MVIKKLIFLLIILMSVSLVSASDISLSPAKVSIDDLLRDGYAQKTIKVRTTSEEPFDVIVGWGQNNIEEWVNVYDEFGEEIIFGEPYSISKSKPLYLLIEMEPHAEVSNGEYGGTLFFRSDFAKGQTVTGTSIQLGVSLVFDLEISGNQKEGCRAEIGIIDDVSRFETAYLPVRIFNDGNVNLIPEIDVDIWDYVKTHKFLSINFDDKQVRPTTYVDITVPIETGNLVSGQYIASVEVGDCDIVKQLQFDILDEGEIASEGVILGIKSEVRTVVGDNTKFIVMFQNTGDKTYDAQFKGDIVLDGKILGVVSSEKLLVKPGETVELEVYYKSENVGKHQLRGYVYFDKKRTNEQTVSLKVFPESMRAEVEKSRVDIGAVTADSDFSFENLFIYIIIGIILILLLNIIKKRKQKNQRFRY